MKSLKIFAPGIASLLIVGVMLVSCTKSFDSKVASQYGLANSSNVQLFLATVGATRNYVYVNSNPVNGAALTAGSVFPATGYGFSVPTGLASFLVRDTLTATTQTQLSFAENMQVGKNYTVFVYDTTTAVKQKTVETSIVIPEDTTSRLRFANFVYNPGIIPAVDIYSKNKAQNIFTNVQVTDITSFIPYQSNKADTFYIRSTGTTTNLQNYTPPTPPATVGTWSDIYLILTPTMKRSYTLIFRGGFRAVTTTNSTVRGLSVFANY